MSTLKTAAITLYVATLAALGAAAKMALLPTWVFLGGIAATAAITLLFSLPLLFTSIKSVFEHLKVHLDKRKERLRIELVHKDFQTTFNVLSEQLFQMTSPNYTRGIGSMLDPLVSESIMNHHLRQAHYLHLYTLSIELGKIRDYFASNQLMDVSSLADHLGAHIASYLSICRQIYDFVQAYESFERLKDGSKQHHLSDNWNSIRDEINDLAQEFSRKANFMNGHLGRASVRTHFERMPSWPN